MSVTPASVVAALATVQAAISAAGTLQGAPDYVLAPIVEAVIAAQAVVTSEIAATDALIGNGSGLAAGTPAAQAVDYLNGQIAANAKQYNLLVIQSYLQRIELNIAARL